MPDLNLNNLILGAHLSIAGGLEQALYRGREYGANAIQLFTKNANTWREKELTSKQIKNFDSARAETGITLIAAHTSYLINIAGSDPTKSAQSAEALYQELFRCHQLSIPYLVLHPGSHMGAGVEAGIKRVAENLDMVLSRLPEGKTIILLENTSGQGSSVGHTFEQLAEMRSRVSYKNRVGFCLDTCHLFAAGYDISDQESYRETMESFDATAGLANLYVIHINDAKKPLGSRVDRHEHIGEGLIGETGFRLLINDFRLAGIPKIIETPKEKEGQDADPINLERLRNLWTG